MRENNYTKISKPKKETMKIPIVSDNGGKNKYSTHQKEFCGLYKVFL
jgi:hypothetical protein